MTVEQVLSNHDGYFLAFYFWAQRNFNGDSVEFILLVRELRGLPHGQGRGFPVNLTQTQDKAKYIYNDYVKQGARDQVNLPSDIRIELDKVSNALTANSFDRAMKNILSMLEVDGWTRFVQTSVGATVANAGFVAPAVAIVPVVVPANAPVLQQVQVQPPLNPPAPAHPQFPPPQAALAVNVPVAPPLRAQPPAQAAVAQRVPPQLPPMPRTYVPSPPQLPPPPSNAVSRSRFVAANVYIRQPEPWHAPPEAKRTAPAATPQSN